MAKEARHMVLASKWKMTHAGKCVLVLPRGEGGGWLLLPSCSLYEI